MLQIYPFLSKVMDELGVVLPLTLHPPGFKYLYATQPKKARKTKLILWWIFRFKIFYLFLEPQFTKFHSFVYSFNSFIHSFIHSFIYSFIHSLNCSLNIHPFISSLNHLFFYLFIHLHIHSFTYLFIQLFFPLFIHIFIRLFKNYSCFIINSSMFISFVNVEQSV